jgi:hypothetical protein
MDDNRDRITIRDLKVLAGPILIIAGLMVIHSTVTGAYCDGLSPAASFGLVAVAGALFGSGIGMYTKMPWYFFSLVFAILFQPVAFVWRILYLLNAMTYHGH